MKQKGLLLAALAALVVAVPLLLAWRMPLLFDRNRYRDEIATFASERLGRKVTIAGPISLTLWPAPELTAEKVDVGGDGSAGSGFNVAMLRLRVGLGALLAGRVEARALVLRGPDLRLPWPLPQSVLASRPPRWLGPFAARIEGGTLRLGDIAVANIDATVTQGEDGLLAASGTATLKMRVARFTFRLGTPESDGGAQLDMTLDGMGELSGTGASFAGTLAADGSLAGHLVAGGTDLALLIGAPSLAFRAEGRLTVGDGLAAMDEATFDLAGAPATGVLALRLTPQTRLDVALSATRLDLDPWVAALLPVSGHGLSQVTLPIGLDLSVEAARLGSGIVQGLRAHAAIGGGAVKLSDVTAVLPGEARLQLAGNVDAATSESPPRFVGAIRLDAPAFRTTLRWLGESGLVKPPLPPGPVLRTAAFTGDLRMQPGSFSIDGLTGRVDGAAIAGSLTLRGGAHPGFELDAVTDRLALDPWLPSDNVPTEIWSPEHWLGPAGLSGLTGGQTVKVSIRAEHATLRGLQIDGLVVDASATPDGVLTVRQLDGAASGLRLSIAGTIGRDGRVTDAKLSVSGPSAAPLAALVLPGKVKPELWKGPVLLELQGAGPPSALAFGVALDLGDARLEAKPVIDLATGAWHASATLHHPDAVRLLGLLGLPVRLPERAGMIGAAGWLGEGSLSLLGQFSGAPAADGWGRVAADSFELTAGALRASGHLSLDNRQVNGDVAADVLPLPLPDVASQAPLPITALHSWSGSVHVHAAQVVAGPLTLIDNAAFTIRLGGDVLAIDAMTGQVGGGGLTGEASLNIGAMPPSLRVAASLSDAAVPVPSDDPPVGLLSGRFDGTVNLTASGYSAAAILATLAGSVRAAVRDGAVAGFDLFGATRAIGLADMRTPSETETALRASVRSGTTSFDRLDVAGDAARGLLRLATARLQGPAGAAEAQGSIGLTDGTLDVHVTLQPAAPDSPSIGLRLDGPIIAPDRQPELAAVARWLVERPTTR